MTPDRPKDEADDDSYVIEDDGSSIEEIESEMAKAAEEAAAPAPPDPAPAGSDDWKERYARSLADFENFRKRTEREKQEFFRHALGGTFREILPVLDNFDRALDHAEEGDEFHRGVALIYKQLWDVLRKQGLRAIDEADVAFDPNLHEAVVRHEDPSIPANRVVEVLQKGYFLNDRLLRPAMVKVSVGGPDS